MPLPEPDDLIEEQIDYYRARAPEYDDWWLRTGRYAPDDDFGRRWDAGKADLDDALREFAPTGEVLEIAAGTGNLTASLAAIEGVEHITAIDSSRGSAGHRPHKGPRRHACELAQADVFSWRPTREFDVVAFGFWLSHVPPQRFERFWHLVREALRPSGRVFFIDNAVPIEQAAAADGRHVDTPWSQTWLDAGVSVRTLADGRPFRIVKRCWEPADLERQLAALGWSAVVREHQQLFLQGEAVPRGSQ